MLTATGDSLDRAGHTLVGRRHQHADCRAAALLEPGPGRAGLTVRVDEAHHYDLEVSGGVVSAVARIGPVRQRIAERAVPPGPLTLVVETRTTRVPAPTATAPGADRDGTGVRPGGPDAVTLSIETPDCVVRLAELDGRYLSTEVAGGFTGRVIGMYVTEGRAAFGWFAYTPMS